MEFKFSEITPSTPFLTDGEWDIFVYPRSKNLHVALHWCEVHRIGSKAYLQKDDFIRCSRCGGEYPVPLKKLVTMYKMWKFGSGK